MKLILYCGEDGTLLWIGDASATLLQIVRV